MGWEVGRMGRRAGCEARLYLCFTIHFFEEVEGHIDVLILSLHMKYRYLKRYGVQAVKKVHINPYVSEFENVYAETDQFDESILTTPKVSVLPNFYH